MKILQATVAVSMALFLAATGIAGDSQTPGGDGADKSREAAARSAVDNALTELLAVLAKADLSSEQRLALIEKIVTKHFDLAATARLALGRKSKKRFSGPQAATYACEFETYLANDVGRRFDSYQQEKVEILSAEPKKSDVIIRTRILGGKYDRALVDFWMRESDGQWRAIDVIFDGVSLVRNLYEQFQAVLSEGGPERLIQSLGEKNGSRSDC
jgi:phospholipid transport system substrate-binding protein